MTKRLCLVLTLVLLASPAWAKREHIVHFQGTPYELHVFHIYGQNPGKTLMLIGGIQGDEPGGFLSADAYADMSLEKGNLIVVPRANFYSIMLNNRGPNGDMNRKFQKAAPTDFDARVVEVLKNLMAKSDLMLNLHDGSGFYRPTFVSADMNPMRFGQSIIADAEAYTHPVKGQTISLGEMARRVCTEINGQIENPLYHFHFNNHRTIDSNSPHKEQRGSASFYALTRLGIPAFGVETSKALPTVELKVRHHNLAINSFMKMLEIIPENPALKLEPAQLRYLVVSVNNGRPVVVGNQETLTLKRGDSVFFSHIEANYERGLSLDILGLGGINDLRQAMLITKPTSVVVRKDNQQFGWIRLALKGGGFREEPEQNLVAQYFVVKVNGRERLVAAGQALDLVKGDQLELMDAWSASGQKGLFALNFKGFVANQAHNTGDDRGVTIPTDHGLMEKWSVDGKGRRFKVTAERKDKEFGEFYVQLVDPNVAYLVVQAGRQGRYAVAPDETLLLNHDEELKVVDLKANFDAQVDAHFVLRLKGREIPLALGQGVKVRDLALGQVRDNDRPELVILRRQTPVGRIYFAPKPVAAAEASPDGAE